MDSDMILGLHRVLCIEIWYYEMLVFENHKRGTFLKGMLHWTIVFEKHDICASNRARGRFSPECPPSAMSNFLHVPLTPNPKISDLGGLDGAGALVARCLYSGFGLFHDSIERFSNFGSSRRRNFASASEIPRLQSVKCQIRRKSRYRPKMGSGTRHVTR